MVPAPYPSFESQRLQSLQGLEVLDSPPEASFDALVNAVALVCQTPISLISLIDSNRQWFKANLGLPGVSETPRDLAFCAHAILQEDIFEIQDATVDPRFAENPLVTSAPHIRFYAGATLVLSDGHHAGTLCVIDRVPRQLDAHQRQVLQLLAKAVVQALEGRRALRSEQALLSQAQSAKVALAQSEARFRSLSDGSPLGVFSTNADGACLYTNSRWQEIHGLTLEQSLGDGWASTLHPDDRSDVLEQWQRAAHSGSEFDMEFRILRSDGTERFVHSRARSTLDERGQISGYVGSVEDVTQARAAHRALVAERQRLAGIIEGTGAGTWEWNVQTGETRFNDYWASIVGYTLSDLAPLSIQTWHELAHPEDLIRTNALLKEHFEGKTRLYECEARMRHRDGQWVWVLTRGRVLTWTPSGQPEWMFGTHLDITERRTLLTQLSDQHELLRVTLQSIGDAVITTDAQGIVTWLNPVAERMTGWPHPEAKGRSISEVFHILNEETRAPAENPVVACLMHGRTVGLASQTVLISRNSDVYGIEDSASLILSEAGERLGAVLVFHDVTEQRRLSGEMTYRATHDALTGLVNRSEFESRLRKVLCAAHEHRSEHALLFIDLDQFKLVNDSCGHAIGDKLLQQVSNLLSDAIRARDTVARLGGDEFAVILEHCPPDHAQRVALQICARMDEFRFAHEERRFRIGASIGLVPVDQRWGTSSAILQAADTACYAAKQGGRNRVHAWIDTDMTLQAHHGEMQWATRIEQALDEDRFDLYAQAISPLDGGEPGLHAEVLLRMKESGGIVVMPGQFLPAAERFHLASRVDRWVLNRVISTLQAIDDPTAVSCLTVNLSGQSIGDRAFQGHALDILAHAGTAICSRLCLEITETVAVTNMTDARLFVEQVRALGVRIALDDFGAGASSFGYLKSLTVDVIKIDGQFIRDVVDDPLDEATVRCFVDVARVLGVRTVAEFVDRPEVLQHITDLGIDFAQGFLLHRPEPLSHHLSRKNGLDALTPV